MAGKITVEICVDSVESALEAQRGGADRVELCDNLMEGGTTPSAGSIEIARKLLDLKVHIIIRPRGGDFLYSEIEFEVMKRDVILAKSLGVDGIVIGLLTDLGEIDKIRTAELIELAKPLAITFHRAFDVSRNAFESLEDLIPLGIDRVLTSGQEATAAEGVEMISELVRRADGRIKIMACGNLNERNIARFVEKTNVQEVHLTGFENVESKMKYRNQTVYMGGALRVPEYSRSVTQASKVRNIIDSISHGQ